ncbi:Hypothetical predicted protein [Paramuricea clavata]|uniref:Uncharacterized protein n=1 Tax=Paramuricea clavata TaxID=317549 RepID=A0A6S7I8A9_PARCT|nr:Hypothetical predicted protein [Paramuricea clavata]
MDDPQESEVSFEFMKLNQPEEKCKPGISTVAQLLVGDANAVVKICGRVTLKGGVETLLSKGKTLKKQEALFTDNSGTIRLVLWENDITKVTSTSVYNISRIVVREFSGTKYLTLNKMPNMQPSQLKSKCQQRLTANVMFEKQGNMLSLFLSLRQAPPIPQNL